MAKILVRPNKPAAKGKLIKMTDWPSHHPWPPIGGLRHIRFNDRSLGADHCFVKVGRTILIDEAAFLEWCRTQGDQDRDTRRRLGSEPALDIPDLTEAEIDDLCKC